MDYTMRKPIRGPLVPDRTHGLYSSKIKIDRNQDMSGKQVEWNCKIAPYKDPDLKAPDRARGKQIMGPWPKQGVFFSKLQYAPDPYTENPKQGAKKMGFGTGKPLSRDDLSSVLQVGRFRSALQNEAKGAKAWEQTIMAEATRLGATRSAMATQRPTTGLAAAQPRFTTAFDRQRHVEEFRINKRPPSEKYDRNYGPMRSTSRDIGEGCFESTHSPDFGIKIGVAAFTSKVGGKTTTVMGQMTYAV